MAYLKDNWEIDLGSWELPVWEPLPPVNWNLPEWEEKGGGNG